MANITYRGLIAVVGIILIWMFLHFNPTLSIIFSFLLLYSGFLRSSDSKITYPVERAGNNRLKSIFIMIISVPIFYIVASLIASMVDKTLKLFDIGAVMSLYAESTPIFADSVLLNYVAYTFLIPLTETFAMLALFELLSDWKSDTGFRDVKFWFKAVAVSIGFMFFHLQAKTGIGGTGAIASLVMVLIMGLISVILFRYTMQGIEGMGFHIILNAIGITMSMALLTTLGPLAVFGIVIGVGLLFVLPSITRKIGVNLG